MHLPELKSMETWLAQPRTCQRAVTGPPSSRLLETSDPRLTSRFTATCIQKSKIGHVEHPSLQLYTDSWSSMSMPRTLQPFMNCHKVTYFKNDQNSSEVPCVQMWQKIPKGSFLNGWSKFAGHNAVRWFNLVPLRSCHLFTQRQDQWTI